MVNRQETAYSVRRRLGWKLMASAAIMIAAAGCTRTSKKDSPQQRLAAMNYSKQAERPPLQPNHPLHIATTHWARKHQKNPADAAAALNYARNLKALGSKDKAVEVLARAYQLNPGHGEIASEYGRLALDLGRVQMAEQLLNRAMSGRGQSDWRVLSAMGTVNAKRGDHKQAQSYYLAALRQKPDATSVYNNLALSYALDGKAGDAENLLKKAVEKGHNTRVVRQNLALVLGLQSKFDEAQKVAQADLDGNRIDSNVTFLRKMVKNTQVAQAKPRASSERKADATVTASLPAANSAARPPQAQAAAAAHRTRARVAAAPMAAAREAAPSARPAAPQSTPLPARKPEAPVSTAKAVPVAPDAKTAEPLPWRKAAPARPAPARVAVLQPAKAEAPTNIAPQVNANWNVTVSAPAAPAPRAANWNPFSAN
jgi:Flp pilus assembly protein TadD